jgi:hypothetical protein
MVHEWQRLQSSSAGERRKQFAAETVVAEQRLADLSRYA